MADQDLVLRAGFDSDFILNGHTLAPSYPANGYDNYTDFTTRPTAQQNLLVGNASRTGDAVSQRSVIVMSSDGNAGVNGILEFARGTTETGSYIVNITGTTRPLNYGDQGAVYTNRWITDTSYFGYLVFVLSLWTAPPGHGDLSTYGLPNNTIIPFLPANEPNGGFSTTQVVETTNPTDSIYIRFSGDPIHAGNTPPFALAVFTVATPVADEPEAPPAVTTLRTSLGGQRSFFE